jgi:AcrR family transcriptional regulator
MTAGNGSPRQRYRDQVRAEIKQAALAQMCPGGPAALSLNAVAKELGVTGPALYKYFRSRDDLLTELVFDCYAAAAAAVHAESERIGDLSPRERLQHLAHAYRRWAVAAPHLYQLLTAMPAPTPDSPPETVDRAKAVLGPFLPVLGRGQIWPAATELREQVEEWIKQNDRLADWVQTYAPEADPATALTGALIVWVRMHGVVNLEVQGKFRGMGHQPSTLLSVEMESVADLMALPAT